MWEQLQQTLNEMGREQKYQVYHNPKQEMPSMTPVVERSVQYVAHNSVPLGELWVVNAGPAGRIVKEG